MPQITCEGRELAGAIRPSRSAQRANADAFTGLVREHSEFVYHVAVKLLGSDAAQDASQEAWVRVWRHIGNFKGESSFKTWLHRITVNACLSNLTKVRRREARERQKEPLSLPDTPTSDNDPESSVLDRERREEILEALEHVREDHRTALILRHMEGLGYREVAEAMNVPVGTAKGWASRGRAELLVTLTGGREDAKL